MSKPYLLTSDKKDALTEIIDKLLVFEKLGLGCTLDLQQTK